MEEGNQENLWPTSIQPPWISSWHQKKKSSAREDHLVAFCLFEPASFHQLCSYMTHVGQTAGSAKSRRPYDSVLQVHGDKAYVMHCWPFFSWSKPTHCATTKSSFRTKMKDNKMQDCEYRNNQHCRKSNLRRFDYLAEKKNTDGVGDLNQKGRLRYQRLVYISNVCDIIYYDISYSMIYHIQRLNHKRF